MGTSDRGHLEPARRSRVRSAGKAAYGARARARADRPRRDRSRSPGGSGARRGSGRWCGPASKVSAVVGERAALDPARHRRTCRSESPRPRGPTPHAPGGRRAWVEDIHLSGHPDFELALAVALTAPRRARVTAAEDHLLDSRERIASAPRGRAIRLEHEEQMGSRGDDRAAPRAAVLQGLTRVMGGGRGHPDPGLLENRRWEQGPSLRRRPGSCPAPRAGVPRPAIQLAGSTRAAP